MGRSHGGRGHGPTNPRNWRKSPSSDDNSAPKKRKSATKRHRRHPTPAGHLATAAVKHLPNLMILTTLLTPVGIRAPQSTSTVDPQTVPTRGSTTAGPNVMPNGHGPNGRSPKGKSQNLAPPQAALSVNGANSHIEKSPRAEMFLSTLKRPLLTGSGLMIPENSYKGSPKL